MFVSASISYFENNYDCSSQCLYQWSLSSIFYLLGFEKSPLRDCLSQRSAVAKRTKTENDTTQKIMGENLDFCHRFPMY